MARIRYIQETRTRLSVRRYVQNINTRTGAIDIEGVKGGPMMCVRVRGHAEGDMVSENCSGLGNGEATHDPGHGVVEGVPQREADLEGLDAE